MKKTVALALAGVLVAGISACGVGDDDDSSGDGKQKISFLVFETPNLTSEFWDEQIAQVTDKHPDITVEKLVSPTDDRTDYARQLLASDQFPDVLIGISPAGFAEAGNLYAWTDEELSDFVYPHNGAVDGKVYQLPANTQTIPLVYYNKAYFQQAGVAAPPTTYAELLAAAEKLKAAGIKPFVAGGQHDSLGPLFAGILGTDLYADNPEWMHDRRAGDASFCDAGFKAGAAKLADLAAKGYIDRADVSRDHAAVQEAFLAGDGAMYPMGNWFASGVDNADEPPDFEIGQFPWPSDDGSVVVPAFTGGGLLVSSSAKHLDAARTFALEFQTNQAYLDNSAKADGLFPAIKGWEPPNAVGDTYRAGFDLYQQALQDDAVVPAFGFEAGDDGMLPGVVESWDASAVDLVTGQRSVDDVCGFLDDEWEAAS
ncbi:MAG TPA: ABC transporter substrate-binding protein [Acidimicrobiales bacterium]|jgi:multiple sugar transport system substrate-binding protein